MDSPFLIMSKFMDNLENKEQGLNGRGPAAAEIWLCHQKECCSHKKSEPILWTNVAYSLKNCLVPQKVQNDFKFWIQN